MQKADFSIKLQSLMIKQHVVPNGLPLFLPLTMKWVIYERKTNPMCLWDFGCLSIGRRGMRFPHLGHIPEYQDPRKPRSQVLLLALVDLRHEAKIHLSEAGLVTGGRMVAPRQEVSQGFTFGV